MYNFTINVIAFSINGGNMQATISLKNQKILVDCAHAIGQLCSCDSCMIKDVVIESALFVVNTQWGKFVCAAEA